MFRAILADDEPRILQALERRLDWQAIGIELAGTATDGNTALALIQESLPDLLITDIRMPGLNGIELARRARENHSDLEIILISGFSEFEYAQEGIEIGVLGYLLKPIQQDELRHLLVRAVDTLQKKRNEIDPEWFRFRSFITRAQTSGRLHEHLVEEGILNTGESLFCVLTKMSQRLDRVPGISSAYFHRIGPSLSAFLISGNKHECSDSRLVVKNVHRKHRLPAGIGTTITESWEIERTIAEAEAAFVRASFAAAAESVEFHRGDPDIRPFVQDAIKSMERGQYDTVRTLIRTIKERSVKPGANTDTLYYLYNALVVRARDYYSMTPATGLLPRPLGGVVDLVFRYTTLEALFDDLETMLNYLYKNDPGTGEKRRQTIIQVREYIEHHFAEDLSLDLLSERFDIEKNQLSQRFKNAHGRGISEFIRDTRIGHAKFLLTTTRMPIATVGELCGYTDYYYFARVFKKETGYTCSGFRSSQSN